jgi:ATP-dependent DNA helicase RecQ
MTILGYFGDPDAAADCQSCGNCLRRTPLTDDQLLFVRKVLSGVARGGERWGRRRIAARLVGQTDDLPDTLVALSTTGLLKEHEPKLVEKWIDALVGAGALRSSSDMSRILRLTDLGREVMAGRQPSLTLLVPTLRAKSPRGGRKKPSAARRPGPTGAAPAVLGPGIEPDEGILAALRDWRREEARARAVPAYVVLHDKTMGAIASERPRSLSDLEGISGIGPTKLEAYGAKILEVLRSRGPGVQGS